MKQLERKFATVTLHKKPVKAIPWTTDEEVEEIIKLLKSIDPGFDTISTFDLGDSSILRCQFYMSSFCLTFASMITSQRSLYVTTQIVLCAGSLAVVCGLRTLKLGVTLSFEQWTAQF